MLKAVSVVIFGVFLQLYTAQGSSGHFCDSKANGNYPDPSNCHGYIACSNHITHHMPCPAELKWNNAKHICDWPQHADPACGASASNSTPSYSCNVQVYSSSFCSGKANGNYPDSSNCHGYIACANSLTYHMPCPAQLKWNDNKKLCDWPQYAYPACSGVTVAPPTTSGHVVDPGNFCSSKPNGNYPDPANCYGYISCSNHLTYHMPCPVGLKWNDHYGKKQCDYPQHAYPACSGVNQWPCLYCHYANSSISSNFCTGKANGNYPDSSNCHGYIACSNGIKYKMPCPANLFWNDHQKRCDWAKYAYPNCVGVTVAPVNQSVVPTVAYSCAGKAVGNYPNPANCHGYITCTHSGAIPRPCAPSNPQLVWNDFIQVCDWPRNVPPPCGTKSYSSPLTTTASNGHTTAVPPNSCAGKVNGNYPNPANCNGYIACSNHITYKMPCPAGLVWNAASKRCDWPRNVPPPCGTSSQTVAPSNFCTGKSNGNYANPANCNGYISCSNGIPSNIQCPANLKWNDVKKICDWQASQTTCKGKGNGNYPDTNNCYGYIACANGITFHMPCPASLMWNNLKKLCDWPKYATGDGCRLKVCEDILSSQCCALINARNDCGNVVGLYCRKMCNRCK